jgi:hypothetical protein
MVSYIINSNILIKLVRFLVFYFILYISMDLIFFFKTKIYVIFVVNKWVHMKIKCIVMYDL